MFGYPAWLKTNRYGFIATFNNPEKDAEYINHATVKIAIVGGSTVEGRGATSNENTIAGYLQKYLQERFGNKVFVINAGLSGSNSYTDCKIFEGILLRNPKLKPDIVIFLNGRNDIYTFFKYFPLMKLEVVNWHEYFSEIAASIQTLQLHPFLGVVKAISNFLDKYSIIYATLKKILHKAQQITTLEDKTERANLPGKEIVIGVKNWFVNMETACYRASLEGIKCYYVIQPLLHENLKPLTKKEEAYLKAWLKEMKMNPDDEWEFIKLMKKVCRESVYCVDFSEIFSNFSGDLYYDNCHYNNEGNNIIARNLLNLIYQDVLKVINRGD
jgi:lysophospholipase L1-like esterase